MLQRGILFVVLTISLVASPAWAQDSSEQFKKRKVQRREDSQALDQLIEGLQESHDIFVGPLEDAPKDSEYADLPSMVFVDPDFSFLSLAPNPGMTWLDCQQANTKKKRALHCGEDIKKGSKLERVQGVPIKQRTETNTATGKVQIASFIKVRHNGKEGWVEAKGLRAQPLDPIYMQNEIKSAASSKKSEGLKELCEPNTSAKSNRRDIEKLIDTVQNDPAVQVEMVASKLKNLVGRCPLKSPVQKQMKLWKGKNIYDVSALPLLLNLKPDEKKRIADLSIVIGPSRDEAEIPAKLQDVIAVDALARTIYSEMNECFNDGLQYPMAAAKVALNRADMVDRNEPVPTNFIGEQGFHSAKKPTVAKTLTAPWQFSVWNYSGAQNRNDKTVLMSLCPTRDFGTKNWKNKKPSEQEVETWSFAVRIATEAILFPDRFREKTKQVTQLYYTSKMKTYDGRRRASPGPQIQGRRVESFNCMYLWKGD